MYTNNNMPEMKPINKRKAISSLTQNEEVADANSLANATATTDADSSRRGGH